MRILTILFSMLLTSTVYAQQFKAFGDYQLHYIALDTTTLSPEVAKKAGLPRSEKIGFFNVSLLDMSQSDDGVPVEPAAIKLSVSNLLQQDLPLDLVIHKEGIAIYYLAMFQKYHEDILWFKIDFQLPGQTQWLSHKFSQKVYIQ